MSEYAVHFTKDGTASAYDTMLTILGSGTLLPSGPFGATRRMGALGDTQKSVCFSEIPWIGWIAWTSDVAPMESRSDRSSW
jgi:hypothetical protein